jgi:hypothetical protein
MKYMKTIKPIFFSIVLLLIVCTTASAQRRHYGGGGYRNYNYYGYNSYRPYHSYASVNFGRPYNYYSYYNRPVYRAPYSYVHFGPAFGFRINVLPFGYSPFYVGGNPYYYYDGIYYRPYSGGGYEVTTPPLGATVKHLPSGAKVTVIDGVKYYELGGTFYQEEITDNNKLRYRVVGTDGVLNTGGGTDEDTNYTAPPATSNNSATQQSNTATQQLPAVGTRFDKLPEGCKTVVIKKEKYYVSPAGVYYQEVVDGNNIRYEVTGNGEN